MDRKALIREYKETERPMGVYQVRNTMNGKVFVGSNTDLRAILNRHQAQMRLGVHPSKELLKDWKEFGQEAFAFETLDTLKLPDNQPDYDPRNDLTVLEKLWLEKLSPYDERGYNEKAKASP